jgi:GT2 family glycosyltransferase
VTGARVDVVIPSWNGADLLPDCLRALAAQRVPLQIVVADNASTDATAALLAREFAGVVHLRRASNDYVAACNEGAALGRAPFVLLLNNDARPEPGCIAALLEALAEDPAAAAAMPKLLDPSGRIASTGIEQRDDLYWVDRDQGAADDRRASAPQEAFGLSGCCLLVRRADWDAGGGFDPDFGMYYEDVDLSLRLRARGRRLLYVPAARCVHLGSVTLRRSGRDKDALGERNRLLVLARHHRERFAAECVRSPWFRSAGAGELQALVPLLAARLGGDDPAAALVLALRDAIAGYTAPADARWGKGRDLLQLLEQREEWIAKLLREVARLRIYRWPWRRLKPQEREFLARREERR